jgi:DNA-binding response OmpR family regulator
MAKILLIDDDETMHLICRAYLTKAGHTLEVAFDGPAGIEKAKTFKPELLLLDLNMPKMSGFDVAKKLKEDPETKGIPIFLMTAMKQEASIQRGYDLGIDDYISKPANMEHLKLRINKFLQSRK